MTAITQKNGRPGHPQTQGKAERFQQTLKKWLAAQNPQPADLTALQALPGAFTARCNHQRPHRSLPRRQSPATACAARPKATPGSRTAGTRDRVRADRIDADGKLTLRHAGRLYHIGTGRTYARTRILMLVRDLPIRVINAATAEILRELVPDPAATTSPPAGHPDPRPADPAKPQTPNPDEGSGSFRCLETSHLRARRDSNPQPSDP